MSSVDKNQPQINPDQISHYMDISQNEIDTSRQRRADRIAEKSWLRQEHPLGTADNIDWKLFALLDADAFIQETPLEGYGQTESIDHFQGFISNLLEQADANPEKYQFLKNHRSQLEKFRDDMGASQKTENVPNAESLDNAAQKLLKHFQEKKVGWIPFGWSSPNGPGHAMMARIDMRKGTVTIVNTGTGVTNHPSVTETLTDPLTEHFKEEKKYQEFLTIEGVSKRRLKSPEFFKFLLELQNRQNWDGSVDFNENNIYDPLIKFLKGKKRPGVNPHKHPEIYKKDQRSGTCAIKSVTTTLYYTLCNAFEGKQKNLSEAVSCYKMVKYLWQTQALVSIAKTIDNSITPSQRQLLEDVMDNLSRSSEKMHKKGLLQDSDLETLQATLDDIKDKVASASVLDEEKAPTKTIDCAVLEPKAALPKKTINPKQIDLTGRHRRKEKTARNLESLGNYLVNLETCTSKFLSPDHPLTTDRLLEYLSDCKEAFTLPRDLGDDDKKTVAKIIQQQFSKVVCALPALSQADGSFWETIPEDRVVPVMGKLSSLMQVYLNIHRKTNNSLRHDAHTTVMFYTLHAINVKLAKRLPETKLKEFSVNYFDLIYEMQTPDFIVTDAELAKRLDDVVRYFDPAFTLGGLHRIFSDDEYARQANTLFSFKDKNYGDYKTGKISFEKKKFKAAIKTNETLRYYNTLLKEIAQKNKYLFDPKDSDADRLVKFMCKPDMIPAGVRHLQESALICQHLHYSTTSMNASQPSSEFFKHNNDGEVTIHVVGGWDGQRLKTNMSPDSVLNSEARKVYDNFQKISQSDLLKDEEEHLNQNKYITRQKQHFPQSLDGSRDLEMLGVEPYEAVARTADFINNHPTLLKHADIQDILRVHLFRPWRLLSQMEDEPQIVEGLCDAIHNALHHNLQLKDLETCLFLAKLGNDLKIFLSKVDGAPEVPDFREMVLNKILPELTGNLENKCAVYKTLVSFYETFDASTVSSDPNLLRQVAEDFLTMTAVYRAANKNPKEDSVLRGVELKFIPLIRDTLEAKGKHAILNAILGAVATDAQPAEWSGTYPHFESETYLIDVEEGTIEKKGIGRQETLPWSILNHKVVKGTIKEGVISCSNIAQGVFKINEGHSDELIATDFAFERNIEGIPHLYLPTPQAWIKEAPTLFNDSVICWANKNNTNEIIVLNNKGTTITNVRLSEDGSPEIYRKTPEGKEIVWVPFEQVGQLQYLEKLETTKSIECWMSRDQKLSEVHLTRSGLTFVTKKRGGERRLFSQQFPGYFLVENPSIPGLTETPKYFTLENMAGEQKVILPKCELTFSFEKEPFKREITQEISQQHGWLEYDLKADNLQSKKVDAQLYLAYLWATQGNHDKAFEVLSHTTALERLADHAEKNSLPRTVIDWLFKELDQDKHPSSQAIYLQLALMLDQNHLKYPLPVDKPTEAICPRDKLMDAVRAYYKNLTNTTRTRLTEKQDKQLYNFILRTLGKESAEALSVGGQRGTYHSKGEAKLGTHIHTFTEDPGKVKLPTLADLRTKFHTKPDKEFTLPETLIHEENYFERNAVDLYRVARSGSRKQRAHLRKILELSHVKEGPYYTLIKEVSLHRHRFPWTWTLRKYAQQPKKVGWKFWRRFFSLVGGTPLRIALIATKHFEKGRQLKRAAAAAKTFSLRTHISEKLAKRPRHIKVKKSPADRNEKLHIEESHLQRTDQAFDDYFNELLQQYFTWEKVAVDKGGDELPAQVQDANVAKKLQAENKDLRAYRGNLPETERKYALKPEVALNDLSGELQNTANTLSTSLATQQAALLWQLNDIPEQVDARGQKETHKAGFRQKLTWEDLRALTLDGSLAAFIEKTHLSKVESEQILFGVADYLVKASRLEQIQLAQQAAEKASKEPEGERQKLFTQNIPPRLTTIRAYKPDSSNVHRLWFEYANHYLYRKLQLDKLAEITPDNQREVLAEMPTGFGKTKTLIPSLNYEKGQGDKLVINVWPSSLEMTNALDVKEQMEESFGVKADRLTFDRSTAFTTPSLKHLYSELKKAKKLGCPVNVRSETLRALELHTLLFLKNASAQKNPSNELREQIGYFLKILRMIRTESWLTIDESHMTLNPLDKLIYTMGTAEGLPNEQVDILEEFFDYLTEGDLSAKAKLQENGQTSVKEKCYTEEIAPALAEHFKTRLDIPADQMQSYQDFVLRNNNTVPEWLENHPGKEQIALLKGLLSQVLKASMKGSVDESYGLSKLHIDKIEYAIAYAGANTPKETPSNPSQFKNPHETMAKTYITYLHKGLAPRQAHKLIDFLKQQALNESRGGMALEKTAAYSLYHKCAPADSKSLLTLKEDDINEVYPHLRHNKQLLFYYIRNIIAPQLNNYPETLVSTVHNFKSQAPDTLSLSATPQDKIAHGIKTHFVPMVGTSGQVTHLLLTKCQDPATLHAIDKVKPAEVLDETLKIVKGNDRIHAAMDVGALCKGLSNREVAEKMRSELSNKLQAQAILFFDDDEGVFKVLDAATGLVQDTAECILEPEVAQTFYDQSRCFGSDIKQAVDAIGLLMTGQGTTKASVGQGAGRMRQWHQNQSVEVAFPKAAAGEIFGDKDHNIKQLLVYWIANQIRMEERNNYENLTQQMDNEVRRLHFDKMLGLKAGGGADGPAQEVDVDNALALFGKFEPEFITHETCNPWTLYAGTPEDIDATEALKLHQKKCLDKAQNQAGLTEEDRNHLETQLDQYPKIWSEVALPEKVPAKGAGLGLECEVLQEIEVEAQVEVQAQNQADLRTRTPYAWPEKLDLFKPGWEKPSKARRFLKQAPKLLGSLGIKLKKANEWANKNETFSTIAIVVTPITVAVTISTAPLGVGYASLPVSAVVLTAIGVSAVALPYLTVGIAIVAGAVTAAALIIGTGLAVHAIVKDKKLQIIGKKIYRVKDVMAEHLPSKVRAGARVFSPNLLVSGNFYRQKVGTDMLPAQVPFDEEQKPLYSVLVICDTQGSGRPRWQVMAVDLNDTPYFHRKLKHDNLALDKHAASKRKRKIGLYDIRSGKFTVQGKNHFSPEEIEDPELQNLLAQAKFLDGEIDYTEQEMKPFAEHLAKAGNEMGHGVLQKFFMEHILRLHPAQRKIMSEKSNMKPLARALGLPSAAPPIS